MFYSSLKEVLLDFLSLLYPRTCLACSGALLKGEELVCTICMLRLPQTDYHDDVENALKKRLSLRFPIKHALSLYYFSKSGLVQHLLHELKYRNHPEVGEVLGRVYANKLQKKNFHWDIMIPVPLHPSRLRARGFNQSAAFAAGLSTVLAIPYSDSVLVRLRRTTTQTKKTKFKRWKNMEEVFALRHPESVVGKHVLIVDDVITTGATIEACAAVLIEGGCSAISVISIATVK